VSDGNGISLRIVYDAKRKQFKQNGRVISRSATRAEVDKLTDVVRRTAANIGERYAKGSISLAQFEIEMRDLIKSGHIVAASVGRGGRIRMTQADWGKVGSRLKKEYGYLGRFVRKLEKGTLAKPFTANRAKKYSSSIVMSYHEMALQEQTLDSVSDVKVRLIQHSKEGCEECTADAAEGWMAVEDFTLIGERLCQNFCLCDAEFSDMIGA
jgi:hypothetical protein